MAVWRREIMALRVQTTDSNNITIVRIARALQSLSSAHWGIPLSQIRLTLPNRKTTLRWTLPAPRFPCSSFPIMIVPSAPALSTFSSRTVAFDVEGIFPTLAQFVGRCACFFGSAGVLSATLPCTRIYTRTRESSQILHGLTYLSEHHARCRRGS